jgi:hypothetical protein
VSESESERVIRPGSESDRAESESVIRPGREEAREETERVESEESGEYTVLDTISE